LSSCNRDNITGDNLSGDTVVEEGASVPLQIGNIINNISFNDVSVRSTTELTAGDIGIFRLESTGYDETRSNVQYTNSGDGWDVTSGTEPIYVTEKEASLFAYSPYSSEESTFTDETLNLTSQIYTSSADLCYQTGVTATSETPVSFTMNHAYAKLKFNLTHDDDYDGNCAVSGISIANDGILSSNTLDISTGTYGSGTAGTVAVNPGISSIPIDSTETIYVLMVPVTTLSGYITLTFTIDKNDIFTTTSKITSLTAGKEYTIDITLRSDVVPEVAETANCYMIAPYNSLKIPVNVRGNGVEVESTGISASISPLSVGILWETSPELISLSTMSSDEKVTITANSATSGNAVIAAYSGENQTGEILWSWHIWVTDYDPDSDTDTPLNGTTYPLTNDGGGSYVFMDRNLGATTVTPNTVSTYGLYYQWGRKDPFKTEGTVTTAAGSSSLANAILNPSTFYTNSYDWCSTPNDAFWGGALIGSPSVKTMFDPSPAGWRVPNWKGSASPWTAFTTDFSWTNFGRTYTDGSFYPAAGCRGNDTGALLSVGYYGYCWSGSHNGSKGCNLNFSSSHVSPAYDDDRAFGFSVRCVQDK